ncbi:hypothetical protein [Geodermatophilus sp. SYSU D01176]
MTVDAPGHGKSPRRLTVELAGIPGSGKSRLGRTLAEDLAQRDVVVRQPQAAVAPSVPTARRLARKAVACGAAALADPAGTGRVVAAIARSHPTRRADVAGRVVQWLVAEGIAARAAHRPGVSIVDEGLVQSLWSIGVRGDVDPVLTTLERTGRGRRADLLVTISVPPELALDRLLRRTSRHSRTQLLDEHEALGELRRGAALLDRLVEWWANRPGAGHEVVVVTGTEECGSDRGELLNRVRAAAGAVGR